MKLKYSVLLEWGHSVWYDNAGTLRTDFPGWIQTGFLENGLTAHGSKTKTRVRIQSFPDHLDFLTCHNSEVASWKRFAITILKNDHTCKYMGLAPTKEQAIRQREIMEKYRNI
jgi:predicted phosphoadenosine phosphosulfate sulfurtransferase